MQLDEEKLEALRSWGERLRQAGGDEYAAVGRAILMLVEEIDRLHIELWHARMQRIEQEPAETEGTDAGEGREEPEPVSSSLRARVQQVLRRDAAADPAVLQESDTESSRTSSAEAWIAALRRQK